MIGAVHVLLIVVAVESEVIESEDFMRIEVNFFSEKQIVLPWNYLDWLQGIFYQAMDRGIPRLAREVHDEGFLGGGKRYKLATFSLLYPERYEKVPEGMRTQGVIRWWVASPLEPLIEALADEHVGVRGADCSPSRTCASAKTKSRSGK